MNFEKMEIRSSEEDCCGRNEMEIRSSEEDCCGKKRGSGTVGDTVMGEKEWGRGTVSGVITIEMSYLIPIILFIFVLVVHTVFYYHDKNILIGAAGETVVLGAQIERKPDESGQIDLTGFYQERIRGKLILFSGAQADISVTEKSVEINVSAVRGRMRIQIAQSAAVVMPEKKIRQKRILESLVKEEE